MLVSHLPKAIFSLDDAFPTMPSKTKTADAAAFAMWLFIGDIGERAKAGLDVKLPIGKL